MNNFNHDFFAEYAALILNRVIKKPSKMARFLGLRPRFLNSSKDK